MTISEIKTCLKCVRCAWTVWPDLVVTRDLVVVHGEGCLGDYACFSTLFLIIILALPLACL